MNENEQQLTNDLTLAINELEKVLSFKAEAEEKIESLNKFNNKLNETIEMTKNKNLSLEQTQKKMSIEINEQKNNINGIQEKQNELIRTNEELNEEICYYKNTHAELNNKLIKLKDENINNEKVIKKHEEGVCE